MCHGMNEWTIQFAISIPNQSIIMDTQSTNIQGVCLLVTVVTILPNKNMFRGEVFAKTKKKV